MMSEEQTEPYLEDADDFRPLGAEIGGQLVGLRLDEYLARQFLFLSRNQWQHRVEEGQLRVNGQAVKCSYRIRSGDRLTFYHPPAVEPPVDRNIEMIWRQGAVMAVFKPANLPMHENGKYRKNTFAQLVIDKFGPEWSAVHRLDKETSGIVICAATNPVRSQLSELLRGRDVFKRYEALVFGEPESDDWIENGAIDDLQASAIRIKKWVVPDGLPAETRLRVLERRTGKARIEAIPKTGRTNQIRIHLAYAGHSIIGDKLYNADENVFLQYWQHGNTHQVQRLAGFRRLCLHAAEISFIHPELDHRVWVQSPLPADLMAFWNKPGRWLAAAGDPSPRLTEELCAAGV